MLFGYIQLKVSAVTWRCLTGLKRLERLIFPCRHTTIECAKVPEKKNVIKEKKVLHTLNSCNFL